MFRALQKIDSNKSPVLQEPPGRETMHPVREGSENGRKNELGDELGMGWNGHSWFSLAGRGVSRQGGSSPGGSSSPAPSFPPRQPHSACSASPPSAKVLQRGAEPRVTFSKLNLLLSFKSFEAQGQIQS